MIIFFHLFSLKLLFMINITHLFVYIFFYINITNIIKEKYRGTHMNDIKVIVMDVDGTLTNSKKIITN